MKFEWHDDGGFTVWDDENCFCIGRDWDGTCDHCQVLMESLEQFFVLSPSEQQLLLQFIRDGLALFAPHSLPVFDSIVASYNQLANSQKQAIRDYQERTITRR